MAQARNSAKAKSLSPIVWAAFGMVVVLSAISLFNEVVKAPQSTGSLFNQITLILFLLVSAAIGALILSNQPRNSIGWLLLLYPVAIIFTDFLTRSQLPAVSDPANPPLGVLVFHWFSGWSWWLLMGPVLLIPLLFPTGRLLSPRWRWVIAALLACFGLFLFLVTFFTHISDAYNPDILYRNPIGFLSEADFQKIAPLFQILLFSTAAASVTSIFVRYRRAAFAEREQIKWLAYACIIFLIVYSINFFPGMTESELSGALFNISLIGIPAAIGAAILRYRLYDIDVIIRRTLIYGSLTLLLGGLYFLLVVVVQRLIVTFTGQESPIALAIPTLAIVLLFNFLRLRVQRGIDKLFFRSRYNAERVMEQFSLAARDEVDLNKVAEKLLSITQETVKPRSLTIWLQEIED